MFTRQLSLIIITSHTLARVDLKGRRQLHIVGCWQRPMLDSASPAALVATALKLAPQRPAKVWILNSELATTRISLPLEVSVLLADGELEHALALEAEGQTGVAATSSRIGSIAIRPSTTETAREIAQDCDHYWLTQVAESEIDAMRSGARMLGAQLVAVAHPNCAAYQASTYQASTYQSGAVLEEHSISSDSIQDIASQWAKLLSTCGNNQRMPLPGAIYVDSANAQQSQTALQLTACLLTASCLGGWAWHRSATLAKLASDVSILEKKITDRESAASQLKLVDTRIARLTDEVAKASQHQNELRDKLQLAEQNIRLHQSNWSDLLDAFRASATDDCWIQRWRVEDEQVILTGLATDQLAVHRFVGRLDQQLSSSCWVTLPANTAQTENENVVSFSIAIQTRTVPNPVSPPATAVVSMNMERQP